MFKKITVLSAAILLTSAVWAQFQEGPFGYHQDALLFSRTYQGGTARMQGIGGAQVALGGDINSAYANPAGLGFMRSGVITLTPSMDFNNTESSYLGYNNDDFRGNFNFSNLGIAFTMENPDKNSKLLNGTFAITLTRKNNFHSNIRYNGINESELGYSSIVDTWLDVANNDGNPTPINSLPDMEYYALQQNLIVDFYDNQDNLAYYNKWIGDQPMQSEVIEQRGAQYEWNFAGGANYNDVLYFGGGLGISTISYYSKATYQEYDFYYDGQVDESINYLSTRNTVRLDGVGVSGNFGLIVRPVDFFRLGFSASTPTYYGIDEDYTTDLLTSYGWDFVDLEDGTTIELDDEYFNDFATVSKYNLSTPWKLSAGSAIFLGKIGFISVDVDYLDYASSKITSNDFNGYADTQVINDLYVSTFNYRIGSEIRLNKLRFRGGYGYDGDPIKESNIDNSIRRISGGLGYRNNAFFADLSFVHTKQNITRQPYTMYDYSSGRPVDVSPIAEISNNNLNMSMTFGVNF
ncbi:MAG: hypothetical protein OCD76_12450 [Reichenbachiella sp.]